MQNYPKYVPFLQQIVQKFNPTDVRRQFTGNMNSSLTKEGKDKDEFCGMLPYQFKYCSDVIR